MFGQPCKRPRDSDLLIERDAHFDRETKKHRPLSWQTGPLPETSIDLDQTLRFRAPTLTPADSSDEEGNSEKGASWRGVCKSARASTALEQAPRPAALQLNPAPSNTDTKLAPLANGDILSPWQSHSYGSVQPSPIPQNLVNQSLNISGEHPAVSPPGYFPTPTQPCSGNEPDTSASMEGVSFDREEQQPTIAVRLPSPISEDETMASSGKTPPSDADMAFSSPYASSPGPSFLRSTTPGVESSTPSHYLSANSLKLSSASAPGTPRKTPALVMGYRADCDKCRRRVPGHYSHIIRH